MEEKIVEAGSETAEKVIETAIENVDSDALKYLGAFGVGVIAGVIVYRKALIPAWNWIQEKRKPKEIIVEEKTETEPPTEEAENQDDDSKEEKKSDKK